MSVKYVEVTFSARDMAANYFLRIRDVKLCKIQVARVRVPSASKFRIQKCHTCMYYFHYIVPQKHSMRVERCKMHVANLVPCPCALTHLGLLRMAANPHNAPRNSSLHGHMYTMCTSTPISCRGHTFHSLGDCLSHLQLTLLHTLQPECVKNSRYSLAKYCRMLRFYK